MPGNHSRVGKQVEQFVISDEPHERYRKHHPVNGERIRPGIPILMQASGGKVVAKDVTYYTILCPECHVPAEYTHDSEPLCPDCGMICSGESLIRKEQMVRDAKAAGRIDSSEGETTA